MATNKVFQENTNNNRARVVPVGTKAGDVINVSGRLAVAITDRGDATKTTPIPGGASLTLPSGGFSLKPNEASVAFDGTWHLPVTGATTTTGNGIPVYLNAGGNLQLTMVGNPVGYTDYPQGFYKQAGFAAVRIGK